MQGGCFLTETRENAWLTPAPKKRYDAGVAPFTGAWIETRCRPNHQGAVRSRPLHGGVD